MIVTWERMIIRRISPNSFIAEARDGPFWAVGSICKDPFEAFRSAEQALKREMPPKPDMDDLL